jgi:hypothetical protein
VLFVRRGVRMPQVDWWRNPGDGSANWAKHPAGVDVRHGQRVAGEHVAVALTGFSYATYRALMRQHAFLVFVIDIGFAAIMANHLLCEPQHEA